MQINAIRSSGLAHFVDSHHLHQLRTASLIRRDDSSGPEVLQHAVVHVVGRADIAYRSEQLLEAAQRQAPSMADDRQRKNTERPAQFQRALDAERDIDLVADEVEARAAAARRRVLHADEVHLLDAGQPLQQGCRQVPFAGPGFTIDLNSRQGQPP